MRASMMMQVMSSMRLLAMLAIGLPLLQPSEGVAQRSSSAGLPAPGETPSAAGRTAPPGGSLVYSAPGADAPFNSSGSWHFRRGTRDMPCQLWFAAPEGSDIVLRVRPDGTTASLLVGMPERPVLPIRGNSAGLTWSAPDVSAQATLWGVGDGAIAVAEVGKGSLSSAAVIQLVGKPSEFRVAGIELQMPPVHPMIWMTFSDCMASPGSLPEGTTARWRPTDR